MIDTHAHLDFPEFDQDREEVISRAFNNGVKMIVNIGVDLERSRKSVELAEKHEGVFAAVGMHPDYFTKHGTCNMKHDWIDELKKMAKHEKVVAIGETGLDYYHVTRNPEPKQSLVRGKHETKSIINKIKERQKEGFLAQIGIARELDLPVIVHCREVYPVASGGTSEWFGAWNDLYEIISSFNQNSTFSSTDESEFKAKLFSSPDESGDSPKLSFTRFVLHCYSGEKKDTERFLKLPNVYFSFSGNITYPKPVDRAEQLTEAVRMIPLDKIMLDSDAPYLIPQEFRGKRNEPAYVKYISEKIAEIKQISVDEVERATDLNARKFFLEIYELRKKRNTKSMRY